MLLSRKINVFFLIAYTLQVILELRPTQFNHSLIYLIFRPSLQNCKHIIYSALSLHL